MCNNSTNDTILTITIAVRIPYTERYTERYTEIFTVIYCKYTVYTVFILL